MGVKVDADADCILLTVKQAPGIYTLAALLEGDIVILRHQELCIIAKFLEFCCDTACDDSIVVILPEFSVGGAFARRELAVAIVDKDFHIGRNYAYRFPNANLPLFLIIFAAIRRKAYIKNSLSLVDASLRGIFYVLCKRGKFGADCDTENAPQITERHFAAVRKEPPKTKGYRGVMKGAFRKVLIINIC